MNTRSIALTAVLAALPWISVAQTPTPAADIYRDEPAVFEHYDTSVRMRADGTGETTTHIVLRVQSEGTARQFSVLSVAYASSNETGTMDYVRVHKADGTTVETPTGDAMEMPSEVTREAPMYSDIREKHLPVRSLSSGDRLEYQFRVTRTKAEAPGQFWGAEHFALDGVLLSQTVTLAVPAETYVQVWSPNHPAAPVTKDGMKTWTWTSSQTKPSQRDENGKMTAADVKDPDEDSDGRKLPSIAWTTFRSWAAVGDWYRSLAAERLQPTATVRAKADELTKNAKTPEEQAQALYRFVATQIRYISLSFGVGRFQPHTPDEVLDHGYGDCKDKDTLLESLLRAKGLTTAPVLIGAGIAPVPDVPSPAVFNHAITTVELPGADGKPQRVWLDSTAEVAPFRVLMPVIRDQQALVIPDKVPAALEKTPADPPFPYKEVFDAVATLDKDGLLKGHMQYTVRSDNEYGFRILLQRAAPAQWDTAIQYISSGIGFGGKVSNADLRQSDPAGPVKISYDYTREGYGDWKNNHIIPLFPMLEVATVSKDKAPEHDIELGAPRTLEAHSTITLPEGYRAELPEPIHVKRDFTTFDKTYRMTDGKIIVVRKVVVLTHKLPKDQWKDYLAFEKETGVDDGETFIKLLSPTDRPTTLDLDGKPSTASTPSRSTATAAKATPARLLEIEAQIKFGDLSGARDALQALRESDPQGAYTQGLLGSVKAEQGETAAGIADLKAELAAHPDDNSSVSHELADLYQAQKRYKDAAAILLQYVDKLNDHDTLQKIVDLQEDAGDFAGAIDTLHIVLLNMKPGYEPYIHEEISQELVHMHRYDEAAAEAESALTGAQDAMLINACVSRLAEMKIDLPLAEKESRRSIAMLEQETAAYGLGEANARAFQGTVNISAAWDTLAYILLQSGKVAEALPFSEAAWFNRENLEVANHLGQIYEALGRKQDALWIYGLALSTNAESGKHDYVEVKTRFEELKKNGVEASGGATHPTDLRLLRTFHLGNPDHVQANGVMRVQLNSAGIESATLVAGDAILKPLANEAKALKIANAEPDGSQARLLRDAVLTCRKDAANCDLMFMEVSGLQKEVAGQTR